MSTYAVEYETAIDALADADAWRVFDASEADYNKVTAKQALTYMWGQTVAAGSTLTLSAASHAGKLVKLDTLTGSVVTLPQATGTGNTYRFVISVVATSNSHKIQVGNATDVIQGIIYSLSDNAAQAVIGWAASATSDTITLDRSTTGGIIRGEHIEVVDIATGVFVARGFTQSSGTEATPWSAAV